jgi:hypothetical protein
MLYRVVLAVDIAAAAVLLFFFFWGVSDGTVSSFNIGIWLAMLAAVGAVLGGGIALNGKGHRSAAIAILLVLGIPALLVALSMLLLIVLQPRWN